MAHSGKTMTFATDLLPHEDEIYNLGNTDQKWNAMYATTFHGELDGNAATATWVGKGTHTAAITANEFTPATGTMTVLGNVSNTTMAHNNNANAEIIIKAHPTSGTNYYEARLGFSSNGTIQHMPVNSDTWHTILDSNNTAAGTNNAATLTWSTTYTIAKIHDTDIKFTTMAKPTYAFTDLTAHPTTLSGYGITDAATSSHTHGNLTNDGKITSTATIANGDKLVIVDNDTSSKITGTSITFDGTTETKALTPKGTWVTFNNYSHPTSAGNKHIPSGGAAGQFLTYGNSSGTAAWSDLPVASTSTAGIIKIGTAATNAMAGNTVVNTVKQSPAPTSNNDEYPILLKTTANTNEETGTIKFSEPTITPKTGRLSATSFMVDSHVTLQWNSTDSSLDFIFA